MREKENGGFLGASTVRVLKLDWIVGVSPTRVPFHLRVVNDRVGQT